MMPEKTAPPKSSDVIKDRLPGHAAFLELVSGCQGNNFSGKVPEKKSETA